MNLEEDQRQTVRIHNATRFKGFSLDLECDIFEDSQVEMFFQGRRVCGSGGSSGVEIRCLEAIKV